jgi:hypothetical protein
LMTGTGTSSTVVTITNDIYYLGAFLQLNMSLYVICLG